MTTLRKFDKVDWYGFAGCESAEPEIGETANHDHVVVLDGRTVQLFAATEADADSTWHREFSDEGLARSSAEMILGAADPREAARVLGLVQVAGPEVQP